jgi:hypothetical protein
MDFDTCLHTYYLNHEWFCKRQEKDPYHFYAEAITSTVKPQVADKFGANRSVALRRGVRLFAFKYQSARDAFCKATCAEPVT